MQERKRGKSSWEVSARWFRLRGFHASRPRRQICTDNAALRQNTGTGRRDSVIT